MRTDGPVDEKLTRNGSRRDSLAIDRSIAFFCLAVVVMSTIKGGRKIDHRTKRGAISYQDQLEMSNGTAAARRVSARSLSLSEFIALTWDKARLVDYLSEPIESGRANTAVLKRRKTCPRCGSRLTLHRDSSTYRCYALGRDSARRQCDYTRSVFAGTWFERTHASMSTICRLVGYFAMMSPAPRQYFLQRELGVSAQTVSRWIARCRQVCTTTRMFGIAASRDHKRLFFPLEDLSAMVSHRAPTHSYHRRSR